jgi:beta-lactam-binding protein with PASTA domain
MYTAFYWSSTYYNSTNYAYYYNGTSSGSNHGVTIIGWDDNYDRNKFKIVPPGNGAFIAKNSWGSTWGQGGYFYLSYYDARVGTNNMIFLAQATSSYKRVYQYDPLGRVSNVGYSTDTAWFANVFTAVADEPLTAVSFYNSAINTDYQLWVYLNPSSGPINPSGPEATQSGNIPFVGYHVITLTSPINLTAGSKFSIVVKSHTPGYKYPVPWERPLPGYSTTTANAGESYISNTGSTWTDATTLFANANVCIKGFTSGPDDPTPGDTTPPNVSITSPANGTSYTAPQTINISASASDNVGITKVDFYDNNLFKASDTTAPYSYSWTISSSNNGAHSFTAVAYDPSGNSTISNPVNLTVNIPADVTPPVVSINSPASGSTVSGTVTITASSSDNVGVTKVSFYRDSGILIGTDTTAPYQVSWDSGSVTNGSHTLYAQASDEANNSSVSSSITVNVNNDVTPPTVSITYPSSGATFKRKAKVTITANASDNVGVSRVEFYVNGAIKCSDSISPYSCNWTVPNTPNKSYQIQARAYDAKGNLGSSSIITVTSIR